MGFLSNATAYILPGRIPKQQLLDCHAKILHLGGKTLLEPTTAEYIFVNYVQLGRVRRELRTIGTPLESCKACKYIVNISWLNEPKQPLSENHNVLWYNPDKFQEEKYRFSEESENIDSSKEVDEQPGNELKESSKAEKEASEECESQVYPTNDTFPYVLGMPRYACQRKSPLVCVNQDFVSVLEVLKACREVNGESMRARAYGMAISSIKSLPVKIDDGEFLTKLPGCGPKITHLWREFSTTGKLKEAEEYNNDPAAKVIRLFYNIFGVGAAKALEWYQKGWRTIEDARRHKDTFTKQIQVGLEYYEDFSKPTTIEEATNIYNTVISSLPDAIKVQSCLVGGFRRGKPVGADIDMVLSPSPTHTTKHLVDAVLAILNQEFNFNLISIQEHSCGGKKGYVILAVILSPESNIHRRIDIIVVPPAYLGSAVLGWSGGIFFLRDLKVYANERQLSFDSFDIVDLNTGKDICPTKLDEWKDPVSAERDVFHLFQLDYIEPKYRNTG
ncbi:DNA polymerase Xfamily [Schizosaccharomyces cryophilus OY26]|uniref:DNA polymerase n=1 Tax=Schizosaccharomyces cryophilus (strain OY26 / ATCC MYA-4695 / CBS 11777 / NBRC 106824 / NRRL Y48691) TaxID=653667 RepID=S9XKC0_SCHCR|nr:DNA polymerase Xfamily [Schizosaccharomyces cryophilus OY26]EPY54151.1 DNA polymerase Xfamily [Schizosaccharomyces cryophilus OY26]